MASQTSLYQHLTYSWGPVIAERVDRFVARYNRAHHAIVSADERQALGQKLSREMHYYYLDLLAGQIHQDLWETPVEAPSDMVDLPIVLNNSLFEPVDFNAHKLPFDDLELSDLMDECEEKLFSQPRHQWIADSFLKLGAKAGIHSAVMGAQVYLAQFGRGMTATETPPERTPTLGKGPQLLRALTHDCVPSYPARLRFSDLERYLAIAGYLELNDIWPDDFLIVPVSGQDLVTFCTYGKRRATGNCLLAFSDTQVRTYLQRGDGDFLTDYLALLDKSLLVPVQHSADQLWRPQETLSFRRPQVKLINFKNGKIHRPSEFSRLKLVEKGLAREPLKSQATFGRVPRMRMNLRFGQLRPVK